MIALKLAATLMFLLFSLPVSLGLWTAAPVCDLRVRMNGASLEWEQCAEQEDCSQCGVTGDCTNDWTATVKMCVCSNGTKSARDTCTTQVLIGETSTTVICLNGTPTCKCHEGFYYGQNPGCNPNAGTLPDTFTSVCNCVGGSEDSDN